MMVKSRLYQSEAWLRRMYLVERLSTTQIAERCGATEMTIYRYLNRFGIKR